jgi:multimeric flavodoxin WrbA
MNVIISDAKNVEGMAGSPDDLKNVTVILDDGKIRPCVGCFSCWIKTPGQCVIKDGYENMGLLLSKCDRLIIVSGCYYGSYGPFAHNVLDRSIPYLSPYFTTINGETHHQNRYDNKVRLSVYFYGEINDREKRTAEKLIKANGVNFYAKETEIFFCEKAEDVRIDL